MHCAPRTGFAGLVALLAVSAATGADIPVNVTQAQNQERQHVAQLNNGTLVFVFEDQSVTNGRILLRRFDSHLVPLGGEQRVDLSTSSERREPVVAALGGGGFVVAFTAGDLDGDHYGVAFRRYDADSNPLDAAEVVANGITTAAQFRPQVAPLTNGGFVLTWVGQSGGVGQDVFYRRFSASGTALDAGDVIANGAGNDPVTAGDQGNPKIAALRDGGFVIVYEDRATDQVFGVRIAADGSAVDAPGEAAGNKQFLIHGVAASEQTAPAIAGLVNGGFVVTFNSETNGSALSRRVMERLFDAGGLGGAESTVGSHTNRWQDSGVVGLPNGDFAVTWQARAGEANPGVTSWAVFEQSFSPTGIPRAAPTQVNGFDAGNQDTPSLAALSNSGYVIAWQSFGQDADGYGVFAREQAPLVVIPGTLSVVHIPESLDLLIRFTGQPGRDHELQGSENLVTWTGILTTNPPDGMFQYVEAPTTSHRFFRVESR